VNPIQARCPLAVAIIPDVIGGTETETWHEASLAVRQPLCAYLERAMFVWHMNESLEGLLRAARLFNFLGIGSCAEFDVQRHRRRYLQRLHHVSAVLDYVELCYGRRPFTHLLRGLGVLHEATRFDSADSANVARNHHRTRGQSQHVTALARRIEERVRSNCRPGGRAYPTSNFAAPDDDPRASPNSRRGRLRRAMGRQVLDKLLQDLVQRVRDGETELLNLNLLDRE
jgi:hypothetical protein